MWWLLLRLVPVGTLLRLLAILVLATAAVAGFAAYDAAAQSSSCSSVMFGHSSSVDLCDVEVDDGVAVVHLESVDGGEDVVITDSSRTTTGEMERHRHTLDEGMNTYRVPLHNPDNAALTVDAEGRIYLWVAEDNLNWTPDEGHPLAMTLAGGAVILVMLIGLQLLLTRGSTKAKNPID